MPKMELADLLIIVVWVGLVLASVVGLIRSFSSASRGRGSDAAIAV
jgi:hypothetical protein